MNRNNSVSNSISIHILKDSSMFYTPTENSISITNALRASNGSYVDDHSGAHMARSAHFAVLEKGGKQFVCPLPSGQSGSWVTSLNPIVLKGGKPHMTVNSVHVLDQKGNTVGEAITAFNQQFKDCEWGKAQIVDVVSI